MTALKYQCRNTRNVVRNVILDRAERMSRIMSGVHCINYWTDGICAGEVSTTGRRPVDVPVRPCIVPAVQERHAAYGGRVGAGPVGNLVEGDSTGALEGAL